LPCWTPAGCSGTRRASSATAAIEPRKSPKVCGPVWGWIAPHAVSASAMDAPTAYRMSGGIRCWRGAGRARDGARPGPPAGPAAAEAHRSRPRGLRYQAMPSDIARHPACASGRAATGRSHGRDAAGSSALAKPAGPLSQGRVEAGRTGATSPLGARAATVPAPRDAGPAARRHRTPPPALMRPWAGGEVAEGRPEAAGNDARALGGGSLRRRCAPPGAAAWPFRRRGHDWACHSRPGRRPA